MDDLPRESYPRDLRQYMTSLITPIERLVEQCKTVSKAIRQVCYCPKHSCKISTNNFPQYETAVTSLLNGGTKTSIQSATKMELNEAEAFHKRRTRWAARFNF